MAQMVIVTDFQVKELLQRMSNASSTMAKIEDDFEQNPEAKDFEIRGDTYTKEDVWQKAHEVRDLAEKLINRINESCRPRE